jgi:hypothetical protein
MEASIANKILDEETTSKKNEYADGAQRQSQLCLANNKGNEIPVLLQANYQLNHSKAIKNKIHAAFRTDISMQMTKGGNIYEFSTGMYEHVKQNLPDFYSRHASLYAKIRYHVESQKCIVDIMLAIHNRKDNRKAFVINLYNTTTKALVNGKNPNLFNDHLEEIVRKADAQNIVGINQTLQSVQSQPDMQDRTYNNNLLQIGTEPRRSERHKKPTYKMLTSTSMPNKTTMKKLSESDSSTPPKKKSCSKDDIEQTARPKGSENSKIINKNINCPKWQGTDNCKTKRE